MGLTKVGLLALILFGVAYDRAQAADCNPQHVPLYNNQGIVIDWHVARRIADCYYNSGALKAANDWYSLASVNYLQIHAIPNSVVEHPNATEIEASQFFYRSALIEQQLHISIIGEKPGSGEARNAFILNPTPSHAALYQQLDPEYYALYAQDLDSAKQARERAEEQQRKDDAATPEQRAQFQYWDALSADEQQELSFHGGSRADNSDARPCHISYDYSSSVGRIEIWYYNCISPGGPGTSSYTFVNGKLTDSASY